jgi:hypothetical protein
MQLAIPFRTKFAPPFLLYFHLYEIIFESHNNASPGGLDSQFSVYVVCSLLYDCKRCQRGFNEPF